MLTDVGELIAAFLVICVWVGVCCLIGKCIAVMGRTDDPGGLFLGPSFTDEEMVDMVLYSTQQRRVVAVVREPSETWR